MRNIDSSSVQLDSNIARSPLGVEFCNIRVVSRPQMLKARFSAFLTRFGHRLPTARAAFFWAPC